MMKLVCVLCVAMALMQQTQSFKIVTIHQGAPPAAVNAAPAPAIDPAALLQGVKTAIAGKLQQVQTLVGSLIQQKTALKQNALNSIQNTLVGVKSQLGGLAGTARAPVVIRKRVYVNTPKIASAAPVAPITPDCTTGVVVDAATSV